MLALIAAAISTFTQPIFSTDFTTPDAIDAFDHIHRTDQLSIVQDPQDPTNNALRIDVDAGDHYGGSLEVHLRQHLPAEPTRLYFRYRLYFDASWTTTTGGKLPGFGGTYRRAGWGGKPSDGTNGWSARGLYAAIDQQGNIPVGSYIYHADMVENNQTYGNSERWNITLETRRWYTIEQEIQLDSITTNNQITAGQADGYLKAWVDGQPVYHRTGLHVRDTDDLRIETVWLNVYHGGKTPAPDDMHLLIDDLWIAPNRP